MVRTEIEEQFNCKVLFIHSFEPYALQTTKPVRTVDDMKGMKIGAIGQFLPAFIDCTGGVGVSSHAAPRYTDMQTGVMDGSFLIDIMADNYKYYEVAKYATQVGWGACWGLFTAVNKDLWDTIPVADQQLMLALGEEAEWWNAQFIVEKLKEVLNRWEQEEGVTVIDMAPEEIKKWFEMCPFWEYAEFLEDKGLPGYDLVEDYFRLGKEYGFEFAFELPSRPAG